MKKKLIVINGTMGVGKSTTCNLLNKTLGNSAWLDGDWCWKLNPFIVNEENKRMVEDHIRYMLRNYLTNTTIDYIIFSWVIHTNEILNRILNWLEDLDFNLYKITLIASEDTLRERLLKRIGEEEELQRQIKGSKGDVVKGKTEELIAESIKRLPLFEEQDTIKINTDGLRVGQIVNEILRYIE